MVVQAGEIFNLFLCDSEGAVVCLCLHPGSHYHICTVPRWDHRLEWRWLAVQASDRNITGNWYTTTDGFQVRAEEVLVALKKGIDCFDWPFYESKNPDMAGKAQLQQWIHFLNRGAVEFREHRWKCRLDVHEIFSSIVPAK